MASKMLCNRTGLGTSPSTICRTASVSSPRHVLQAPRTASSPWGNTLVRRQGPLHSRQQHSLPPPPHPSTLPFSRILLVLGASIGVVAATRSSGPLHASTDPVVDLDDPLSALSPAVLCSSTSHLAQASMGKLFKQYVVFLGSSQQALVEAGPWMLKKLEWTRENVPVLGSAVWALFTISMKGTFYDVFVGGKTVPDCESLISAYAQSGVGCLLNYSAEASVDGSANATGVNDAHIREACNALIAASKICSSTSPAATAAHAEKPVSSCIKPTLIAIKLTGLIFEPQLLARATLALNNSTSSIWGTIMSSEKLFPDSPILSDEDHDALQQLHAGLRSICTEARKGGVRLLVDAEQSWFQPAIDRYVDLLAEEFNKVSSDASSTDPAIPIVHNTYQCYLRTTPPAMAASIARAEEKGYSWGAKLVRGAYVESERKRWSAAGSKGDCIVWNNKAETDECYDSCALLLEERIANELKSGKPGSPGTGAFYASHNGTSTMKVLAALRRHGLAANVENGLAVDERVRGRISFAQLLGMSDNLTNTLVHILAPSPISTDAPVPLIVKSVPYASVDQALPYLIRRANENQSILQSDPTSGRGGAKGERKAVGKEIRARCGIPW